MKNIKTIEDVKVGDKFKGYINNEEYVIDKIIKTGKIAEKLGAKILGLGAFTAVVGDAGITVAKNLNIPVTTGNSYTVATAIEGTKKASEIMGKNVKDAEVLVI